jgi:hypothetical protein
MDFAYKLRYKCIQIPTFLFLEHLLYVHYTFLAAAAYKYLVDIIYNHLVTITLPAFFGLLPCFQRNGESNLANRKNTEDEWESMEVKSCSDSRVKLFKEKVFPVKDTRKRPHTPHQH